MFNKFGFKLDIKKNNLKISDYLGVTLDLCNDIIYPFRKSKQQPCYIDIGCKHRKYALKQIQNGIKFRFSTISSNPKYNWEMALEKVDAKAS